MSKLLPLTTLRCRQLRTRRASLIPLSCNQTLRKTYRFPPLWHWVLRTRRASLIPLSCNQTLRKTHRFPPLWHFVRTGSLLLTLLRMYALSKNSFTSYPSHKTIYMIVLFCRVLSRIFFGQSCEYFQFS